MTIIKGLAGLLSCCWLAATAVAQTSISPNTTISPNNTISPSTSNTRDRQGQVVTVDRLEPSATDIRPSLAENVTLTPEVKERLRSFNQFRTAYLRQREELMKKLQGSTEEERAKLRDQLKQQYAAYLERARQVREQLAERQRLLLRELPNHREVLENARERARDQIRESTRERRRGED